MKKLSYLYILMFVVLFNIGCTKNNMINTGFAEGNHDMPMWDYFKTDPYNWDSLRVMITHAGLEDIFKGKGNNITFFGVTNHSIRRYLLQNELEKVTDIMAEDCKNFILTLILNDKIMLNDFMPGTASSDPMQVIGKGGKMYKTMANKELWIYTFREPYNEVPNIGAMKIYLVSPDTQMSTKVASSNIMTQTGVVHSLSYNFTLGDF